MNIQEFAAKLSSDNNRSSVFATLRKLTAMDSPQLAAFKESSEDVLLGEWAIWNGSNANNAACVAA